MSTEPVDLSKVTPSAVLPSMGGFKLTGNEFDKFAEQYPDLMQDLKAYYKLPGIREEDVATNDAAKTIISSLMTKSLLMTSPAKWDGIPSARRDFVQTLLELKNESIKFRISREHFSLSSKTYQQMKDLLIMTMTEPDRRVVDHAQEIGLLIQLEKAFAPYALRESEHEKKQCIFQSLTAQEIESLASSEAPVLLKSKPFYRPGFAMSVVNYFYDFSPSEPPITKKQDEILTAWLTQISMDSIVKEQFQSFYNRLIKGNEYIHDLLIGSYMADVKKNVPSLGHKDNKNNKILLHFFYRLTYADYCASRLETRGEAEGIYKDLLSFIDSEDIPSGSIKAVVREYQLDIISKLAETLINLPEPKMDEAKKLIEKTFRQITPRNSAMQIEPNHNAKLRLVLGYIRVQGFYNDPTMAISLKNILDLYRETSINGKNQPQYYLGDTDNNITIMLSAELLKAHLNVLTNLEISSERVRLQQSITNTPSRTRAQLLLSSLGRSQYSVGYSIARHLIPESISHALHALEDCSLAFKEIKNQTGLLQTHQDKERQYIEARLQLIVLSAYHTLSKKSLAHLPNKENVKLHKILHLDNNGDKDWYPQNFTDIHDLLDALDGCYQGNDTFMIFAQNNPRLIENMLGLTPGSKDDLKFFKLQIADQELITKKDIGEYESHIKILREGYEDFLKSFHSNQSDQSTYQEIIARSRLYQLHSQMELMVPPDKSNPVIIDKTAYSGFGQQKWNHQKDILQRFFDTKDPSINSLSAHLALLKSLTQARPSSSAQNIEELLWRLGGIQNQALQIKLKLANRYLELSEDLKPGEESAFLSHRLRSEKYLNEIIEDFEALDTTTRKDPEVRFYVAEAYKGLAVFSMERGLPESVWMSQLGKAESLFQSLISTASGDSEITQLYSKYFEKGNQSIAYIAENSLRTIEGLRTKQKGLKRMDKTEGEEVKKVLLELSDFFKEIPQVDKRNMLNDGLSQFCTYANSWLARTYLIFTSANLSDLVSSKDREKLLEQTEALRVSALTQAESVQSTLPVLQEVLGKIAIHCGLLKNSIILCKADLLDKALDEKGSLQQYLDVLNNTSKYLNNSGKKTLIGSMQTQSEAVTSLQGLEKYHVTIESIDKLLEAGDWVLPSEEKSSLLTVKGYSLLAGSHTKFDDKKIEESLNCFQKSLDTPHSNAMLTTRTRLGIAMGNMEYSSYYKALGNLQKAKEFTDSALTQIQAILVNPDVFRSQRAQAYFLKASILNQSPLTEQILLARESALQGLCELDILRKDEVEYDSHLCYSGLFQLIDSFQKTDTDTDIDISLQLATLVRPETHTLQPANLPQEVSDLLPLLTETLSKGSGVNRNDGMLYKQQADQLERLYQYALAIQKLHQAGQYEGVKILDQVYRPYSGETVADFELRRADIIKKESQLAIDQHDPNRDAAAKTTLLETVKKLQSISYSHPRVNNQSKQLLISTLLSLWETGEKIEESDKLTVNGQQIKSSQELPGIIVSLLRSEIQNASAYVKVDYQLTLASLFTRLDRLDEARHLYDEIIENTAPNMENAKDPEIKARYLIQLNWARIGLGGLYSAKSETTENGVFFQKADSLFRDILESIKNEKNNSPEYKFQAVAAYTALCQLYGKIEQAESKRVATEFMKKSAEMLIERKYSDYAQLARLLPLASQQSAYYCDARDQTVIEGKMGAAPVTFTKEAFMAGMFRGGAEKRMLQFDNAGKTYQSVKKYQLHELTKSEGTVVSSGDYRTYFSSELALVDMEIQRGNFMNAETMLSNIKLPPDQKDSEEWQNIKRVVDQTLTLYRSRIFAENQQPEKAINEMMTLDTLFATIIDSCFHFLDDPDVIKLLLDSGVAQLQCRINKTQDDINGHILANRRETLLLTVEALMKMASLQQEMGNLSGAKRLLEVADVFITEQNKNAQVALQGKELDALYLTNLLQKANLEKECGYLKKAKSTITLLLKEFSSRKCENWDLRIAVLISGSSIFLASGQKEDIQSALRMLTEGLYLNTETLHIEPPENLPFNFKLALQQHRFEIPLAYGQILLLSQEFEKADKVFATLNEELIDYHKENVSGINYYRELFQALLGHARSLLQDKNNLTKDRKKQIEAALSFIDDSLEQQIGNNKIHDNGESRNEFLEAHIDCKEMMGDFKAQRGELKAAIKFYREALDEANQLTSLTGNRDNKHNDRIIRLTQNIEEMEMRL